MQGNSRAPRSDQEAPHPRLRDIVRRHLNAPYRRVPSDAGQRAFASLADRLQRAPFVLDAGCGTGAGTFALAHAYRDCVVLGVDKSAARLAVGARCIARGAAPPNALLMRCELVDFWQLASAAGLRCASQCLFYPNPWPKPAQLQRRWHAHAVLPAMLALGGTIQLRTNWRIYAQEFAQALAVAGRRAACARFTPPAALTPFEAKYLRSGHRLWRCVAEC